MLFLWFLGIFLVIFVLQKVRAHSESTNDDSSKEANLLAEKYHRFKSPLRCLNIADQKIYYIHDLSRPTNCKMFDIKTKQELDGTWTVVPSRGGASCFKFPTVRDMDSAHSFDKARQGCCWFDDRTLSSVVTCIETGSDTYECKTTNQQIHATHYNITPLTTSLSEYKKALKELFIHDCMPQGGGVVRDSSRRWSDDSPIPVDEHMAAVAAALYQYSRFTDDPNDSLAALFFYRRIGSANCSWNDFMTKECWLTWLIAAAMNSYVPEEYNDHVTCDEVKYMLKDLFPEYEPVFDHSVINASPAHEVS